MSEGEAFDIQNDELLLDQRFTPSGYKELEELKRLISSLCFK